MSCDELCSLCGARGTAFRWHLFVSRPPECLRFSASARAALSHSCTISSSHAERETKSSSDEATATFLFGCTRSPLDRVSMLPPNCRFADASGRRFSPSARKRGGLPAARKAPDEKRNSSHVCSP
eukprot:scaffold93178_cov63-Phaeocystis_antarctica.AAC.2